MQRLEAAGERVARPRYLLRAEVTAAAELGFSLVIGKDRWLLLRFPTPELASAEARARGYSIAAGRFLFWSDPPGMYENWLTITRPDEVVAWSPALEDPDFRARIESACG